MGSRSNSDGKQAAYGDAFGYQPPTSGSRPVAAPPKPAMVQAAMTADTGATRPMPASSPTRYTQPMPFAKRGEEPVGIGGAARRDKIFAAVDQAQK